MVHWKTMVDAECRNQSVIAICICIITGALVLYRTSAFSASYFGTWTNNSTTSIHRYAVQHRWLSQMDYSDIAPYEDHNKNMCSVPILYDDLALERYTLKTNPKRTECSAQFARKSFIKNNNFIGDGVWFIPENVTFGKKRASFVPNGCLFASGSQFDDAGAFLQCARRRNIQYILITGDSNGHRLFDSALEYFKGIFKQCTITRSENVIQSGNIRDSEYFYVPTYKDINKLYATERGCSYCLSQKYHCTNPFRGGSYENVSIDIEYIAMTHYIDSTVRLGYYMASHYIERKFSADTLAEYLLRFFFPHHGFPDFWLMHSPFHHEIWSKSDEHIRADLIYFQLLLDMYLPKKTKIFYLTDQRECPKIRPAVLNWMDQKADRNHTRNERIHQMNQILFQVLKPKLKLSGSNVYGFLDIGKISCPVTCKLHLDGNHMIRPWYMMIIKHVLQIVCSE